MSRNKAYNKRNKGFTIQSRKFIKSVRYRKKYLWMLRTNLEAFIEFKTILLIFKLSWGPSKYKAVLVINGLACGKDGKSPPPGN